MEVSKMRIEVETDKRINIYKIWGGMQLILCKNSSKYTAHGNKKWILFWPSTSDERTMLRQMQYSEKVKRPTEFLPSKKGFNYLRKIVNADKPNEFIAEVEYIKVNGLSQRLWNELRENGEFNLWDIQKGPLKYFRIKDSQFIAIYRVYKIPLQISREDIVPDSNGNLPSYHKRLNETKSDKIFELIKKFEPIMPAEEFNKRRKRILETIQKTRFDPRYNFQNEFSYNKDGIKTHDDMKYKICIYCGEKLPAIARYCKNANCGKEQVD